MLFFQETKLPLELRVADAVQGNQAQINSCEVDAAHIRTEETVGVGTASDDVLFAACAGAIWHQGRAIRRLVANERRPGRRAQGWRAARDECGQRELVVGQERCHGSRPHGT